MVVVPSGVSLERSCGSTVVVETWAGHSRTEADFLGVDDVEPVVEFSSLLNPESKRMEIKK